MKRIILLLLVALGWSLSACDRKETTTAPTEAPKTAALPWLHDFEAAKTQARAQNRLLMILFTGSDWCPPCKMMERDILAQPAFADYAMKNLVLLEVDFPHQIEQTAELKVANRALAEKYQIEGVPTVMVLNPAGETVGRLGYMAGGAAAFIGELEPLRGGGASAGN